MSEPDLIELGHALPDAWRSTVVATIGRIRTKVLRMDQTAYPEERHPHYEALMVLDGMLALSIDGRPHDVHAGETVIVPARVPHAVRAGSSGVLMIMDEAPAEVS
jgi:quercetin dioxygenase-like cupin family protein